MTNANDQILLTNALDSTGATATKLELDVRAHRATIIARLSTIRHDTQRDATHEREKLKAKLVEVAYLIRENVVDGWANLNATAKFQFGYWMGK